MFCFGFCKQLGSCAFQVYADCHIQLAYLLFVFCFGFCKQLGSCTFLPYAVCHIQLAFLLETLCWTCSTWHFFLWSSVVLLLLLQPPTSPSHTFYCILFLNYLDGISTFLCFVEHSSYKFHMHFLLFLWELKIESARLHISGFHAHPFRCSDYLPALWVSLECQNEN